MRKPFPGCYECGEYSKTIAEQRAKITGAQLIIRLAKVAERGGLDADQPLLADLGMRVVGIELDGRSPQEIIEDLGSLTARPTRRQTEYETGFAEHLRNEHQVFTEPVAVELAPGIEVVAQPNAAPAA